MSFLQEKVYFARRLPVTYEPELILPIENHMSPDEVMRLYLEKTIDRGHFLYNGPWLFSDRSQKNNDNIPHTLQSLDAVKAISQKIENSSILIAVLTAKSFGTITEIGYAAGKGNIAVYAFPDPSLTEEEIKDLWFAFQMAATTSYLWKEEHFEYAPSIMPEKITLSDYKVFLKTIKAPFLK